MNSDRSNITTHESPQSIEHYHLRTNESRSILAGGVGRVRSQFLEFGDDYLHKPAPTDPIINPTDLSPYPHIKMVKRNFGKK